jgi:hypothetical protein
MYWFLIVTGELSVFYKMIPQSTTYERAINPLLTSLELSSIVSLFFAIALALVMRHYGNIPIVRYNGLRALRRWSIASYSAMIVFFVIIGIEIAGSDGLVTATTAAIAFTYAIGLLFPFVDWMLLFFAMSSVTPRSAVYGQLGYWHLLSEINAEPRLCEPARIRFVLIGCYRTLNRAMKLQIQGIQSLELRPFFSLCQLAVTTGRPNDRTLISLFATRIYQILSMPDPFHRKPGRIIESLDQIRDGIVNFHTVEDEWSIKISWPARLRERLPAFAGTLLIISQFIASIVLFALEHSVL